VNRAVTKVALFLGAAGLTVLSACGGESMAGEPAATDPAADPPTSTSTDSPPSSEDASGDYSLSDLCGLLTAEEAEGMGAAAPGRPGNSISDGHPICTWTNETSLVVRMQEGRDLSTVQPSEDVTVTQITVDGLPAIKVRTASINSCEIAVETASDNLVGTSAAPLSAGEGKYDPCAVADEFAAIVVPRVKDL